MEVLVKILQFLLSLSILVMLHELGHFVAAKIFKVRVEKFFIFFNPWFSLFRFKKGETEYGMGWLPLGGLREDRGNDRRVDGSGANEGTCKALRVPFQAGLATVDYYDWRGVC